jgi:Thioredoxin
MRNHVEKALTHAEYMNLIDNLLAEGKTTGENQSEDYVHFGKLNRQRIKRLEKTIHLNESLVKTAQNVERKMIWLSITEGWCGDAAQNLPAIQKIADESPNIEMKYLLRDENLDLMDKYLTNGGRAIPIVICLDANTYEELGKWGSRPKAAQDYFLEMKSKGLEKAEMMENLQRWYNADKEQSLQAEFENLLKDWSEK